MNLASPWALGPKVSRNACLRSEIFKGADFALASVCFTFVMYTSFFCSFIQQTELNELTASCGLSLPRVLEGASHPEGPNCDATEYFRKIFACYVRSAWLRAYLTIVIL